METTFDEQIVGEIYCYDRGTSLLVLRKKIENSEDYDIVMLKQEYIKSVEVLKKGKMEDIVLPSVSLQAIARKEKEIEKEMQSRQLPKLSPYGNYVFAHLSKFTVCQWDNGVIVVDDNVRIAAPYGIEDVTGDEKSVKTVKEWLEIGRASCRERV